MPILTEAECRELTEQKSARGQCEGDCKTTHGGHAGETQTCRVTAADGYDWGWWSYCQNAQAEDKERGFTVSPIDRSQRRGR